MISGIPARSGFLGILGNIELDNFATYYRLCTHHPWPCPMSQVQFSSLAEIAHLVNASSDLGTMLDRITYATCHYTAWDMCSIMSVDEEAGLSVLMARFDPYLANPASAPRTWELSTSPVYKVLTTKKPLILDNVQRNTEYRGYREDARARNYNTVAILPLPARDQYGRPMIIAVQSRDKVAVDGETIAFLEAAAHLAAIAVEKAQRLREESMLAERIRYTIESVGDVMRKVLSDKPAIEVLAAVEVLLDCPAAVSDHSAQAVIMGKGFEASRRGDVPSLQPLLAQQRALPERLNGKPAYLAAGSSVDENGVQHEMAYRREALLVDGELAGSLFLLTDRRKFDQVDEMLIQQVTFALSVLLMRSVIRFKEHTETQSKILGELLSGRPFDQEDLLARSRRSGLSLSVPARLILIGMRGSQDEARQILRENHRAISFVFNSAWPDSVDVIAIGSGLAAVITHTENVSETRWRELLRRSSESVKSLFSATLVFSPSQLCSRLGDYVPAWQACQRAFQLAERFNRAGIVHEKDFGPHALMLAAIPMLQADAFIADALLDLESHDSRHRGDLLGTLERYLLNGCKLQKCALELKIHVTTLRYRLEKIREICALDLDDSDARFSLELALRLRKIKEPVPSPVEHIPKRKDRDLPDSSRISGFGRI